MYNWYQGKDNNEATQLIIAEFASDDRYAKLCSHLQKAHNGLHKQSLEDAAKWAEQVNSYSILNQRDIVRRLMLTKLKYPDCTRLYSYLILTGIIHPVMKEWLKDDENNVELLCWMGILHHDIKYFITAWSLDNNCQFACDMIISACISDIDYQCHHLSEGLFIGNIEDAKSALSEASHKCNFLKNNKKVHQYKADIKHYSQLINLYDGWKKNKTKSFIEYCQAEGFNHCFTTTYYYDKSN